MTFAFPGTESGGGVEGGHGLALLCPACSAQPAGRLAMLAKRSVAPLIKFNPANARLFFRVSPQGAGRGCFRRAEPSMKLIKGLGRSQALNHPH